MENILIVISEHDIPVAETLAKELVNYKVVFFDPTLADVIQKSSLENDEFVDWNTCLDYPNLVNLAHGDAATLEQELNHSLRHLLPGGSIIGWQHLNLYYFFMAYHWYSNLWRDILEKFEKSKPHIFVCDNPSNYYWPSFIPALLLLQQLRTSDISFTATRYGKRPDESDVVINLCESGLGAEKYDILTHLPTCFYDIGYFNDELQVSGKSIINIIPKYWGVELDATKNINLLRIKDQQLLCGGHPRLDALSQHLSLTLDTLLTPYIATPSFRERQASHLSNLYQSQLISLYLLEQYFSHHQPKKILLSDHDAGFHGPLVAFAEENNIPVYMVPHSKTSLDTEFNYENITILTHPIQGITPVNSNRKQIWHYTLAYRETFSATSHAPTSLNRIGLLLNGISLNGILCTNFSMYIKGIKLIAQWCQQQNLELIIRCRPGQSLFAILTKEIGISDTSLKATLDRSLQHFTQNIDVCLMYDAPTNACIEFLQTGTPILNPIPDLLARAEIATTNQHIVPPTDIENTLNILGLFISDQNYYHTFRNQQFADYINLFKNSYALHRFL